MDPSDWRYRTGQLMGDEFIHQLATTKVALFGLGGVGGFCLEGLVRMGIGRFHLVDVDTVTLSNLNRQILATHETLGQPKVEVARNRILSINPDAEVEIREGLFSAANESPVADIGADIVVDAIDGLNSKVFLLQQCLELDIPVVASMGAGRRLNPTRVRTSSLDKVFGDPLASRVRSRLRRVGLDPKLRDLQCVWSDEPPTGTIERDPEKFDAVHGEGRKRHPMPSMVTVPAAAGFALAYLAVERIRKG